MIARMKDLARRATGWLTPQLDQPQRLQAALPPDLPPGPVRLPDHRHHGPTPEVAPHVVAHPRAPHDQPWVPSHGRVDRLRRSERRG